MSALHHTSSAILALVVPAARDERCNGRKAGSEV